MKTHNSLLLFLLLGLGAASGAWADHWHHHGHVGIFIDPWGPPLMYPYHPYPVYPYYPPAVVVTPAPQPPVYVEQQPAPAVQQDSGNWWYYCPEARAYYPYVKQCAKGWQRVAPQPPQ